MNDTQKLFKIGILEYKECVHAIFEMSKLLPPPMIKNDKYDEDNWDTIYMAYKGDVIKLPSINKRPPLEIVINIRPLDIEAPWDIVSSARNQGNPI